LADLGARWEIVGEAADLEGSVEGANELWRESRRGTKVHCAGREATMAVGGDEWIRAIEERTTERGCSSLALVSLGER
jgi:hypothetical protein